MADELPSTMPTDTPLLEVLRHLEQRGVSGQLRAVDGGDLQCLTCRRTFAVSTAAVDTLTRLEGVSDPADMLAVVALVCPHCDTAGVLVAGYGPDASPEDAEVLAGLDRHARLDPPEPSSPAGATRAADSA